MKQNIIIILLLATCPALAQTLHNNNAIIIQGSASIHLNDLDNNGFILNNGAMSVSGDWSNKDIYQGNGSIELTGSNQSFANNDQSIATLMIDGGGTKEIQSELKIKNKIYFNNGIVQFNNKGSLLIDEDATIEGGSPLSFVAGPLTATGTGFHYFPVGIGRNYTPVWFTGVKGIKPTFEVEAHENISSATNASIPLETTNSIYWTRNDIDGKFNGSTITAMLQSVPTDHNRVVFIEAGTRDDIFDIVNNDGVFSENGMDVVLSKDEITKTMFTVGTLPEEPIRPAYLSTTLSPNAINVENRCIKMMGADLAEDAFHFEVYNRWGNKLFESSSLDQMSSTGWDGKQNGQFVPSGAYPYRVSWRDRLGKDMEQTGFITVVY